MVSKELVVATVLDKLREGLMFLGVPLVLDLG
jgi:hypothetical protein